jgi:predicted nucleic acid binding AN1-type Zn finger protein
MSTPTTCNWCKKTFLKTEVCECGNYFCTVHKYMETHECRKRFKEAARIKKVVIEKTEKTPRCTLCKKKTLSGIVCKCNNYYCLSHRHMESHECRKRFKDVSKKREQLKIQLNKDSISDVKIKDKL